MLNKIDFRNPVTLIVLIVGLVVVGAAGWYFASPLFIDRTVDEAFPGVPSAAALEAMPEDELVTIRDDVLDAAAEMPDKEMDEPMPSGGGPVALRQGNFVDADAFHQGSGLGTIFEVDGERILRLEDFNVTNGPDLHVILATGDAPSNRGDLGDYIDLGPLKGNIGNQNYEIPADVNLDDYQSIVIYCMPFHVVFSTATLN